jgi:hypothetical protein
LAILNHHSFVCDQLAPDDPSLVGDSSDDGDGAGQLRASQQSQTRVPIVHAMTAVPVQQLVRPLAVAQKAEPVELKKLEEVEEFQHVHGLSIDPAAEEESTAAPCESTICPYCLVTRRIATGLLAKVADLETRLQESTSDSISTQIDARLEGLVAVQIATAVSAAEARIAEIWQAKLDEAAQAANNDTEQLRRDLGDLELDITRVDQKTNQLRATVEALADNQRQALAKEVQDREQADASEAAARQLLNQQHSKRTKQLRALIRRANKRINVEENLRARHLKKKADDQALAVAVSTLQQALSEKADDQAMKLAVDDLKQDLFEKADNQALTDAVLRLDEALSEKADHQTLQDAVDRLNDAIGDKADNQELADAVDLLNDALSEKADDQALQDARTKLKNLKDAVSKKADDEAVQKAVHDLNDQRHALDSEVEARERADAAETAARQRLNQQHRKRAKQFHALIRRANKRMNVERKLRTRLFQMVSKKADDEAFQQAFREMNDSLSKKANDQDLTNAVAGLTGAVCKKADDVAFRDAVDRLESLISQKADDSLTDAVSELQTAVKTKAENKALIDGVSELKRLIGEKADDQALTDAVSRLGGLISQKADGSLTAAAVAELQSAVKTKAEDQALTDAVSELKALIGNKADDLAFRDAVSEFAGLKEFVDQLSTTLEFKAEGSQLAGLKELVDQLGTALDQKADGAQFQGLQEVVYKVTDALDLQADGTLKRLNEALDQKADIADLERFVSDNESASSETLDSFDDEPKALHELNSIMSRRGKGKLKDLREWMKPQKRQILMDCFEARNHRVRQLSKMYLSNKELLGSGTISSGTVTFDLSMGNVHELESLKQEVYSMQSLRFNSDEFSFVQFTIKDAGKRAAAKKSGKRQTLTLTIQKTKLLNFKCNHDPEVIKVMDASMHANFDRINGVKMPLQDFLDQVHVDQEGQIATISSRESSSDHMILHLILITVCKFFK